ncbi:hypothetical protein GCM10009772_33550 [Pseudonocardia alni subsp. carboxydivorans]
MSNICRAGRKLSPSSLKIGSKFFGAPAAPNTNVPPAASPPAPRSELAQAVMPTASTPAMTAVIHRLRIPVPSSAEASTRCVRADT